MLIGLNFQFNIQQKRIIFTTKIQEEMTDRNKPEGEYSNSSLFSTELSPLAMPQKKTNRISKPAIGIQDKINELTHEIITQVSIFSPFRVRERDFRDQLSNFRYQRRRKTVMNIFQNQLEIQQQSLLLTMTSILQGFRNKINNKFYILFPNGTVIFYFFHSNHKLEQSQSFLLISSQNQTFSNDLDKEGISYSTLNPSESKRENLVIRNRQISLFWGYLLNRFISQDSPLQVFSNFSFANSIRVRPYELYNSTESRPEYSHLVDKHCNILGHTTPKLYFLRLQGYWMAQNIKQLSATIRQKTKDKFQLQFEVMPCTVSFKDYTHCF